MPTLGEDVTVSASDGDGAGDDAGDGRGDGDGVAACELHASDVCLLYVSESCDKVVRVASIDLGRIAHLARPLACAELPAIDESWSSSRDGEDDTDDVQLWWASDGPVVGPASLACTWRGGGGTEGAAPRGHLHARAAGGGAWTCLTSSAAPASVDAAALEV